MFSSDQLPSYIELIENIKNKKLDFDDAYQLTVATEYSLTLVTMDGDFKKVESDNPVLIL